MPPFSDQNSSSGGSEQADAEIITPLKVHPAGTQSGRSSRRRFRPAVLVVSLAALVAAGIWLIGHVGRHAALPPLHSEKEVARLPAGGERPATPPDAVAPPAANSAGEKNRPPAAAPPPDAAERQTAPPRAESLGAGVTAAKAAAAETARAVRRNRITALERMGSKAETAADWQAAREHYAAILAIDPDQTFARQGVDRARHRLRVLAEMESLVGQPDALLKKEGLDKALATLREARALDPKGPELQQRLDRLEGLVAQMQKPVRLVIRSDNRTRVDVYRVGRLGRFLEKMLDLKPGVYVVVGHREGYQDIRHELIIRPGEREQRVTVICKVKV